MAAAMTNEQRLLNAIRGNRSECTITLPEGAPVGTYWGDQRPGATFYNYQSPPVTANDGPFISGVAGMMIDPGSIVDRVRVYFVDPTQIAYSYGSENYIGELSVKNPILFNLNRPYGALSRGVGLYRIGFESSYFFSNEGVYDLDTGALMAPLTIDSYVAPILKVRLFLKETPAQVALSRPPLLFSDPGTTSVIGAVESTIYCAACMGRSRISMLAYALLPPNDCAFAYRIMALVRFGGSDFSPDRLQEVQVYPVGGGTMIMDGAGVAGKRTDNIDVEIPDGAVFFTVRARKLSGAGNSCHITYQLED